MVFCIRFWSSIGIMNQFTFIPKFAWKKAGLLGSLYVAQFLPLAFFLQTLPAFMRQQGMSYGVSTLFNFTYGMTSVALSTIMMDNTRLKTAGTDYTLQATILFVGSLFAAGISGFLATSIGYGGVFIISGAIQKSQRYQHTSNVPAGFTRCLIKIKSLGNRPHPWAAIRRILMRSQPPHPLHFIPHNFLRFLAQTYKQAIRLCWLTMIKESALTSIGGCYVESKSCSSRWQRRRRR